MRNGTTGIGAIGTLAIACCGSIARAEGPRVHWSIHLGVARLTTNQAADVYVSGSRLPDARIIMPPRYTAAVEVARYVSSEFAVGASVGIPVRSAIDGAGTIRPFGRIGRIVYGPAALTAEWHPLVSGAVGPYLRVGVAYMHVFRSKDGALRDARVRDDVGPVVQGGFEIPIDRRFGLFADARKAWLRPAANGTLAGLPVSARLRLDPLVLHTGVALSF